MSTQQQSTPRRRIVLTAIGSPGDLHPSIALALGLQDRGHHPIIATSSCYQNKIHSLGLAFHAIRPDSAFTQDAGIMQRMMHPRWGIVRVGREIIMPAMLHTYEDISAAARGADLLISHPLTAYATRLVSEVTGIPWASTMITPLGFMSACDFPIISVAPMACRALRQIGPTFSSPLLRTAKRATRRLAGPWYHLRNQLGLPPATDDNPLLDSHSPRLVLALFSPAFAAPQPDWPPQTLATGFPIADRDSAFVMPPALSEFLNAGPPPIVFTLGCSAAMVAENFFETSIAVAQQLNQRAVLITGPARCNLSASLPPGATAHAYAPFLDLFPKAAVIVHPAGIGTLGHVLRSGRPSLAFPFAHDQLDNAARLARLGVARTLPRHRYTTTRVAAELEQLLNEASYTQRATETARKIQQENAIQTACNAIETMLT